MEESFVETMQEYEEKNKDLKDLLDIKEWLNLNAKLSQKKNKARQELTKMGVLEKKGKNTYDNYKYFTEAQYKDVANKLLSNAGLELKVTEKEYFKYSMQGTKTPIGRITKMLFTLTDMETGFYEESVIRGEGLDRGDKAGYKAYTGAIKYYLANTFLIPTGDDPETESPNVEEKTPNTKSKNNNQKNTTQKTEIDYKTQLINAIKEKGLNVNEYAKEHKLSANTTQEEAKKLLEKLNAN